MANFDSLHYSISRSSLDGREVPEVSLQILVEFVDELAPHWEFIGYGLGQAVVVQQLKARSGRVDSLCMEMFAEWINRGEEVSWDKLLHVLHSLKLRKCAKNIKKRLTNNTVFGTYSSQNGMLSSHLQGTQEAHVGVHSSSSWDGNMISPGTSSGGGGQEHRPQVPTPESKHDHSTSHNDSCFRGQIPYEDQNSFGETKQYSLIPGRAGMQSAHQDGTFIPCHEIPASDEDHLQQLIPITACDNQSSHSYRLVGPVTSPQLLMGNCEVRSMESLVTIVGV
jgi:hypothetical protein